MISQLTGRNPHPGLFQEWGKHNVRSSFSFARCRWRVRIVRLMFQAMSMLSLDGRNPLLYFGRPPQCLPANPPQMGSPHA